MNFSTFNLGRKIIIDDSLILCLDAASPFSYPGSGNTWFDLSKYKQDVTLFNSPTFSNLGFGSIQFNGTNQYGFCSLLSPGITNSPFTISTWLYSTATSATQTWTTIGSALGQVIEGILYAGGSSNFYYSDYNSVTINVPYNNILNNWYNVVLYLDSSFAAKMYVNGVLVGSDTATNYLTGNSILMIGAYYPGGGPRFYYNGYISNFYVYNRALSEQEILQNFNALKGRFGIF